MSALDWLNGEAFTAFDQHILWSDMAGNLLGLGALALGWRRSLLTWPVQLLSGLVLVAAYASAHLSGGIGKQIVVVTVAVWGWTQWRRGRGESGRPAVRFATWTERAWLVAGTAAGTVALALLFTAYPKLSWDPWPDAYIFVGTLTAMVAQARGWVEFWFAWLAVDVVGVPLAFNNGLAFSGLVYVIYFVLVVLGLRAWWLQTRTDRAPSGTVPDGATA
ncbi:nicotinamide mononucleotide transporter family protein [Streptomyces sp. RKAG337]|uniref:nicotinamide mononucleotide transporter family protein n=1 Tax=Streptomyces sp. RKAG337 TaxID=2893404 RepID=UPI002033CBF3|nr:nicotinamide mononucleotide transporter family protein [Streptomyces sp. RKAG337]MCM2429607.1 nicotinamide mononucleotide transporter family protein [Streptomyces sp. RKAG337]